MWRLGFDVRGLKVTTGASKKRQLEPCVELNDIQYVLKQMRVGLFSPINTRDAKPCKKRGDPRLRRVYRMAVRRHGNQTNVSQPCVPSKPLLHTITFAVYSEERPETQEETTLGGKYCLAAGCVVASFGY